MQAENPLFRRPDYEEGVNLNNSDQILLKPGCFAILGIEPTHDAPINNDNILREVKKALLVTVRDQILPRSPDRTPSAILDFPHGTSQHVLVLTWGRHSFLSYHI